MKRIVLVFVFFLLCAFPILTFAQTAKIVDIKGKVVVKKDINSEWLKAKPKTLLDKGAELMTKEASECTLTFDEAMQNIVTIKENTLIKIESITPGNINLPQGRVFSLIKNLSKVEKFQVRTPTAIAGARATGWETAFEDGTSFLSCFEDTIHVQGLDPEGNVTGEEDLGSGFGLEIGADGRLGNIHELSDEGRTDWGDFTNNVNTISSGGGAGTENEGAVDTTGERGALQELRDESRETVREQVAQENREEATESGSESTTEREEGQGNSTNQGGQEEEQGGTPHIGIGPY
jgi:hypothetical protein